MTMTSDEKTHENLIRRMADRQGYRLVKSRRRDAASLTYGRYLLISKFARRPRTVEDAEAALAAKGMTLSEIETKLAPVDAARSDTRQPRTTMKVNARYGHWTVLSVATTRDDGYSTVACICDCGFERRVRSQDLRLGKTRSCGRADCEFSSALRRPVTEPKVGDEFGWWTVIAPPHDSGTALCQCRCGRERRVNTRRLRSGDSKSCGCRAKWRTGPFAPTQFDRAEPS
jgi:hypothetical protein